MPILNILFSLLLKTGHVKFGSAKEENSFFWISLLEVERGKRKANNKQREAILQYLTPASSSSSNISKSISNKEDSNSRVVNCQTEAGVIQSNISNTDISLEENVDENKFVDERKNDSLQDHNDESIGGSSSLAALEQYRYRTYYTERTGPNSGYKFTEIRYFQSMFF